jgi:hypothetical protein
MDDSDEVIRIPAALPLPGQDAGRTLWGMVDWTLWNIAICGATGKFFIIDIHTPGGGADIEADTPALALLKALAAQWKVQVI